MNYGMTARLRRFCKDESGSVLPLIGVMFGALLGTGGLTLDAGHSYFSYRQLQASTNAAALAGAKQLPSSNAVSVAVQYSSVAGNLNVKAGLPNVAMVSGYPMLKCLTKLQNQGLPCLSPSNANAIQVKQTVAIPLYFAAIFGRRTQTMTASATAAMRGGSPTQYNVAIVMDTTLSMNAWDSDCNDTEMDCELSGVRTLLQTLTPCVSGTSSCTFTNGVAANSVDRVSLFAFPNVTTNTAYIDSNCTTGVPGNWQGYYSSTYGGYDFINPYNNWGTWTTATPYSGVPTAWPYSSPTAGASSYAGTTENLVSSSNKVVAILQSIGTLTNIASSAVTYQITPFLSDYRTFGLATSLNPNSALVKAAGAVSNCNGIQPPNFDGNWGTSYAGALYAAQASLVAQKAANPGSTNVIILLSDGNANTAPVMNYLAMMPGGATSGNGTYPSLVGQCGQGVVAAKAATAAGTRVYTVAYGALDYSQAGTSSAPTTGVCPTDVGGGQYPNITPCQAMKSMASAPQYFYSDYNQSGSGSDCESDSQPLTKLSDIFSSIANDLTVSRLIPDSVN